MSVLFANFAESTLAGPLDSTDLTLTVQTSEASRFPSPTGSDYFLASIFDGDLSHLPEIVKVTARNSETLTIVRAQESTTARSWNSGAKIRLAPTAALYTAISGLMDFSSVANGSILAKSSAAGLVIAAPGVTTNDTQTLLGDSLVIFADTADATKKMQFELNGITTANIRTLTVPDLSGTIALMGVTNVGTFTANSFIPTSSTVPTNGMYLPAANTVGFAAGSVLQFRVTTTASATNIFSVTGSNGGPPILSTNAGGMAFQATGNVTMNFQVNGGVAFAVSQGGSAPISYLQVNGNTSTNEPSLLVVSTQTDMGMRLITKGTGVFKFWTNGGVEQFRITHTASADRYIIVTGSNGGNPTISVTAGSLAITPAIVCASTITFASASLPATTVTFTNGAAAATGTLTNAPAAGDPTKWIPINDNGTTRYIPAW